MNLSWHRDNQLLLCSRAAKLLCFALRRRYDRLCIRLKNYTGLDEIDADKTFRFVDKIWESRGSDSSRDSSDLIGLCVRRDYDDKHGQRVAFPRESLRKDENSEDLIPVLDAIDIFDENAQPSDKMLVRREEKVRWGTVRKIEPQISAASLAGLLEKKWITPEDVHFLEVLGDACGVLDPNEMIAIGRHESAETTTASILWELYRWKTSSLELLEELEKYSTGSVINMQSLGFKLWQCWSYALECKKKSGLSIRLDDNTDREHYSAALSKLLQLSKPRVYAESVRPIVERVQKPPDNIWDDVRVSSLAFPAFCAWAISTCVVPPIFQLESFKDSPFASRLSTVSPLSTNEAYEKLRLCRSVDPAVLPQKFSMEALDKISSGIHANIGMNPQDLIDGTLSLPNFLQEAQALFDYVVENFIDPKIDEARTQRA